MFSWLLEQIVMDNHTSGTDMNITAMLTLEELNNQEALRRLGTILYMSLLIIIGLPGNILVLFIYWKKYKISTHRTFILALAWVDLISCSICMPFEIAEMNFQYTFYAGGICKFFRFINTMMAIASGCIIIALSIDRYRRVCNPLGRQMTIRMAEISCLVALGFSVLLSWPMLLFYGRKTIHLDSNRTGVDCAVSDAYLNTKDQFIHSVVLFLITILSISALFIIYGLIGRKVIWHSRFQKSHVVSSGTSSGSPKESSQDTINTLEDLNVENADDKVGSIESVDSRDFIKKDKNKRPRKINTERKITLIAFLIALLFIISYIPYLILVIVLSTAKVYSLKPGPLSTIGTRTIYIHNIINPILFGFSDNTFRKAAKDIFCKKKGHKNKIRSG